jgi:hypothetical protein
VLTRVNLEHRIQRLGVLLQLFANRNTTGAHDRTWAIEAITTLTAIEVEAPAEGVGDTRSGAVHPTAGDMDASVVAALAATGREREAIS